jgi:hypothetical protein
MESAGSIKRGLGSCLALLSACLLSEPSLALAGPVSLFSSAGVGIDNRPPVNSESTIGASVGARDDKVGPGGTALATGVASALASPGLLEASAFAFAAADGTSTVHSGAIAQFDGLDIVVTGPGSTPAPVSFNFAISGAISGSLLAQTVASPFGTLDVLASVTLCGSCLSTDVGNGRVNVGLNVDRTSLIIGSGTGSLTGYTGGIRGITSAAFMVTPGTPFGLAMELHPFMFGVSAAIMNLMSLAE